VILAGNKTALSAEAAGLALELERYRNIDRNDATASSGTARRLPRCGSGFHESHSDGSGCGTICTVILDGSALE
jgi:hypothetical protein